MREEWEGGREDGGGKMVEGVRGREGGMMKERGGTKGVMGREVKGKKRKEGGERGKEV